MSCGSLLSCVLQQLKCFLFLLSWVSFSYKSTAHKNVKSQKRDGGASKREQERQEWMLRRLIFSCFLQPYRIVLEVSFSVVCSSCLVVFWVPSFFVSLLCLFGFFFCFLVACCRLTNFFRIVPTERKIFLAQNADGKFTSLNTFVSLFYLLSPPLLTPSSSYTGLYPTFPYYMSKVIGEVPLLAMQSLVFCSILYWLVGYKNDADGKCTRIITLTHSRQMSKAHPIFFLFLCYMYSFLPLLCCIIVNQSVCVLCWNFCCGPLPRSSCCP